MTDVYIGTDLLDKGFPLPDYVKAHKINELTYDPSVVYVVGSHESRVLNYFRDAKLKDGMKKQMKDPPKFITNLSMGLMVSPSWFEFELIMDQRKQLWSDIGDGSVSVEDIRAKRDSLRKLSLKFFNHLKTEVRSDYFIDLKKFVYWWSQMNKQSSEENRTQVKHCTKHMLSAADKDKIAKRDSVVAAYFATKKIFIESIVYNKLVVQVHIP